MNKVLVIGAAGQVGTELVTALRRKHGRGQVIASDIRQKDEQIEAPYVQLDATDAHAVKDLIVREGVDEVYLMAAMLSATAEKHPMKAWQLNMDTLFIVLELAKDKFIKKLFWPSSIAVFGPDSKKELSPQQGVLEPTTVYGISKAAGESWCAYYHEKYGVDVRSVRYPGLIGSKALPGGGTTDYAVHIFYEALEKGHYTSFLSADRKLPMMHMDDAIRATLEIMNADEKDIQIRTSYNISGSSFEPQELAKCIQAHIPDFTISYAPDYRDGIAASWPGSIDDSQAQKDWAWRAEFDTEALVANMLSEIKLERLA